MAMERDYKALGELYEEQFKQALGAMFEKGDWIGLSKISDLTAKEIYRLIAFRLWLKKAKLDLAFTDTELQPYYDYVLDFLTARISIKRQGRSEIVQLITGFKELLTGGRLKKALGRGGNKAEQYD